MVQVCDGFIGCCDKFYELHGLTEFYGLSTPVSITPSHFIQMHGGHFDCYCFFFSFSKKQTWCCGCPSSACILSNADKNYIETLDKSVVIAIHACDQFAFAFQRITRVVRALYLCKSITQDTFLIYLLWLARRVWDRGRLGPLPHWLALGLPACGDVEPNVGPTSNLWQSALAALRRGVAKPHTACLRTHNGRI